MNMENWDIDEIIRDFRQSENNEMKDSYRPEPEQPPEPKKPPEPEYLPEPENLPEPERVPEPERRVGSPKGKTHVFRSILVNGMYSVLCLLCVLWAFFNLHPTGISANTVIAPGVPRESAAPIAPEATPEPVPFTAPPAPTEAPEAVFAETQPTPEPVPEKIRYTIPEDAVSGPVPNPESWSFAQLDSPERKMRSWPLIPVRNSTEEAMRSPFPVTWTRRFSPSCGRRTLTACAAPLPR